MSVDKLASELIVLLREMLASQQRLLQIAILRQDAMQSFDIARMTALQEQEGTATLAAVGLEMRRRNFVQQFRQMFGAATDPSVSEIARRCAEPTSSQLLGLAGQVRAVVEQLDKHTRINAKVSEAVVTGLAKVLKIITGLAQHAGLYMRNGKKAAMKGIHLLEITG